MSDFIHALGGLPGLAALMTSIGTLWQVVRVRSDTKELRPNHGSSVADKLTRIESKVNANSEALRSQGHQLGEIRRDLTDERHDRQELASRVRHLEQTR